MRQVVRLLNEQKLEEATKEYERSMALKDGLRYLNTFGFSNWGQSDLRQKRQSDGAVEEEPGIFRRKREADDVAQPLRYLTGFGFTSLGIKRAKMMEASHPGLMYLISFGFSNFGQKRTISKPAEELMKYLSSFGFARFGQKRALQDKDPRLEYLLGFGFGFGGLVQDRKRTDVHENKLFESKENDEGEISMKKRMDSIVGSDQWGRRKRGMEPAGTRDIFRGKRNSGVLGIDLWGRRKREKPSMEVENDDGQNLRKRAILGLDLWGRRKRITSSRNIWLGTRTPKGCRYLSKAVRVKVSKKNCLVGLRVKHGNTFAYLIPLLVR